MDVYLLVLVDMSGLLLLLIAKLMLELVDVLGGIRTEGDDEDAKQKTDSTTRRMKALRGWKIFVWEAAMVTEGV